MKRRWARANGDAAQKNTHLGRTESEPAIELREANVGYGDRPDILIVRLSEKMYNSSSIVVKNEGPRVRPKRGNYVAQTKTQA